MENVLISTVFCQRPIWDPSHDLYKHTTFFRTEWKEFAKETGKNCGEFTSLLNKIHISQPFSFIGVTHDKLKLS